MFLVLLIGAFLLGGCASQEPIIIVVTPTQDPNAPTISPVPTLDPTATASPTDPPTATLTPLPPTATHTPQPTATVDPSAPTATIRGPIIGPEYVVPTLAPITPTLLSIPTVSPTPGGPTPTPGPSPTPVPGLDWSRMGLQLYSQLDQVDFETAISSAIPTGVGWLKIQVNWAFVQPGGPEDTSQLQLLERQVEAAARPGFNLLLSIAKAPAWARSNRNEDGPPDDPQALANFIALLLTTKIGEVTDAIEVWNEPNLIREWQGVLPFNGAGYMQLFVPAHDAIRAASPSIVIVTAGLAPVGPNVPGARDDRAFLREMYAAGLARYTDVVVGIHPYGWGNAPDMRCCNPIDGRGWDEDPRFFFLDTLEDYHEIMIANGHNVQMWVTEFGWATWDGIGSTPPEPWMTYNTAQDQAAYAIRAFEIGQSLPYVGPMFLWNLNFANVTRVQNREEVTAYSILNPAIIPNERPLYRILSLATGGPRQ